MSDHESFTEDEWRLLMDVPVLAGATVMVCGRSGLGTFKEAFSLARGLLDIPPGYESNSLIQSVVDARQSAGHEGQEWRHRYEGSDPRMLEEESLRLCGELRVLLDGLDDQHEAQQFKDWVGSIAQRVAEAAKEGGFLGIGGQRVSDEEQRVLRELDTALGRLPAGRHGSSIDRRWG